LEQIFRDKFSGLKKTWIFDLDGTLVKHNGYLIDGDVLLDGVKDFFDKNIDIEDYVLILTARKDLYREETEKFLLKNNIRYDKIIFNLPFGERLLFNDIKQSGLMTAFSYNLKRNGGLNEKI